MHTRMPPLLLTLLALVLSACGPSEREREAAAEAAVDAAVEAAVEATRAATVLEVERAMAEALRLTTRQAGEAEEILRPLPVMTPGAEEALRRYRNAAHVDRARALGVRVGSRAALDSLVASGLLIELEDSTEHWIVRPRTSPAYVVPHLRSLLGILGERFQARLATMDLPPYRIEVTSALRTSEGQARLRGSNANAAAGVSSHEFGTTVDVSYAAFAPPAGRPDEILAAVPAELAPHVGRIVDLAFESVSARKSRELGAIFSQVLSEAQREGLALVIYERQQTIYHLTVASALADAP
jgi:hypothetical protein